MSTIDRLNTALEGRYRVERELGEGGMATVYLAEDLKHRRRVALKVLKPELAAVVGADRFLAEIETTANLHHPHILPLFDSGEAVTGDSGEAVAGGAGEAVTGDSGEAVAGGADEGEPGDSGRGESGGGGVRFLFYVMPYVEDETLRHRLDRKRQLPVDEALGIATSVAGALQHAHDRGIVHRDIKPGNILLQDGQPVVADFGIALAVGGAGGARLTETGLSMGTPYYMSPEQATGDQEVGPASDIYALACVLYEMLVGEPPYPGATAQAVLGKIIQGHAVSATAMRKSVPPNVDAAIRKALEKIPADRFTDAHDFAKALADPGFRHGEPAGAAGPSGVQVRRLRWVAASGWAVGIAALAALAVFAGLVRSGAIGSPGPEPRVERFADPFLSGQGLTYTGGAGYDLSPDGSMLVYRHVVDDDQILMLRRWDDLAATPIRGSVGGRDPAISLDGRELAFERDGQIHVLAFSGGPVRTLADGVVPEWGPDGFVYAETDEGTIRVPSTGGPVERISRLAEGEARHMVWDVLPDGGRALMCVQLTGGRGWQVHALDLESGERTPLVDGYRARYLPSGHLTYGTEDGTLMAARFDPDRMELLGTPVAVLDGLAAWSISDDGKLLYTPGVGGSGAELQLVWVSREGEARPVDPAWTFTDPDANRRWRLSPDGSRVALRESTSEGFDIWIKRLDTGPRSRLTFAQRNVLAWRPGADSVPAPLFAGAYREINPEVSPDGRWIAYASDETGRFEIYVRPFPDVAGGRWQVSIEGGRNPRWSGDGSELFFVGGGLEMMVAEVEPGMEPGTDFVAGTPSVVFESDPAWLQGGFLYGFFYDVTPDGERFLVASTSTAAGSGASESGAPPGPTAVLVNNFFEELRARVPEE